MKRLHILLALAAALLLASCAVPPAIPPPLPRLAADPALAPASQGPFVAIEDGIRSRHGAAVSGFALIDRNDEALRWRLALIDSARSSIDMQYYVWFGDQLGALMIKRVLDAANRGVKVRLLIDDLNSLLRDATTVDLRDDLLSMIDAHPNVEMRLFNPWTQRELAGRVGEMISDLNRMNQRMHNKALIVDNRATILGGRNLGDEYFGLNPAFNFHDLDVLAFGPVARQASDVFDRYWNSRWVLRVADLKVAVDPAVAKAGYAKLLQSLRQSPALAQFDIEPQVWSAQLATVTANLHYGSSRVESDLPTDRGIEQQMVGVLYALADSAQKELLITNAYIIPDDRFIGGLQKLKSQGVRTRVLTNSLASHDVPAVNSHYKQWRKPLRQATDGLYEMRHDAAIKPQVADTAPTRSQFMGLHSKGMVIDRRKVFIGSMNFDPRSANINTEMGVIVDSPGLAEALAQLMERDFGPANSWRVEVLADGSVTWTHDSDTVTRQPARSFWQRVEDVIFMAFPRELY